MVLKIKRILAMLASSGKRYYHFAYVAAIWYLSLVWTVAVNFESHPRILDISSVMLLFAWVTSLTISYKVFGKDPRLFTLIAVAITINGIFLLHQQPQGYTYDLGAHLFTIKYFGEHFTPQPITMGGEAHQPPLYYALSGLLYWFTAFFDKASDHDARTSLAALNHFFFSMFLLYGVRIIISTIRTPLLQWLGVIALLFWPANLLHSFRISNDILLYLSFIGCITHTLKWLYTNHIKELKRGILWMAVAFGTKNSALLLPLMLAPLVLYKFCGGSKPSLWFTQLFHAAKRFPWKALSLPLLLLLIMLTLGIGRNVFHAYTNGNASAFEGKNGDTSTFVFTPTLIEFDYPSFINIPYAYNERSNDHLFWNLYLRTMNFGEYGWNGLIHAKILNLLLLGLWLYAAMLAFLQIAMRKTTSGCVIYGVFLLECVIATACMRMYANGFPAWADTRHLYVVVIFFLLFYLAAAEHMKERCKSLYWLGVALLGAHTLIAFVHIILQITYGKSLPIVSGS